MGEIVYRELRRDEASQLGSIDRSERIDAVYRVIAGKLELEAVPVEVAQWEPHELHVYVRRLEHALDAGGAAIGAWDELQLVGLASLDPRPVKVGGKATVLKLDLLYVSARHRRRGIARRLIEVVSARAQSLGADALYVSATPTRATVDFYRQLGAEPLSAPDPALFVEEPDDIHLLFPLLAIDE